MLRLPLVHHLFRCERQALALFGALTLHRRARPAKQRAEKRNEALDNASSDDESEEEEEEEVENEAQQEAAAAPTRKGKGGKKLKK